MARDNSNLSRKDWERLEKIQDRAVERSRDGMSNAEVGRKRSQEIVEAAAERRQSKGGRF